MKPNLSPGKVYRTSHFRRYGQNPTRYVAKLVADGKLKRLQSGLYYVPRQSSFGEVPPTQADLLKARFEGQPFLVTGPSVWNTLGLGTTAIESLPLVYNKTVSGQRKLGPVRFEFRRVRFPREPSAEFFIIDLLENRERAGLDLALAERALRRALATGRFDRSRLDEMAEKFGSLATRDFIQAILA